MTTEELIALQGQITPGPWSTYKCGCGHRACDQHIVNVQRSSGFDLANATLIATAPDLLAEVIRLRQREAEARAIIDAGLWLKDSGMHERASEWLAGKAGE